MKFHIVKRDNCPVWQKCLFYVAAVVLALGLGAVLLGALGWLANVPTQLYQALPFVITAIVLVVSSIRTKENSGLPASLGVNYFREER